MALDTDKITHTALKLLNEIGLDALSTRKLAAELSIQSPSLYKHFRSKAELFDHMGAAMLIAKFSELDRQVDWDIWLHNLARASRDAIRGYRDGARLLITTSPSEPRRTALAIDVTQPLLTAGFAYGDARHAVILISSMVEGWMLNEQTEATCAMMVRELGDLDDAFDKAVAIIIAGIKTRRKPCTGI